MLMPQNQQVNRSTYLRRRVLSKTLCTSIATYLFVVAIGFFRGDLRGSRTQTSAIANVGEGSSEPTLSMAGVRDDATPTIKTSPIAGITTKIFTTVLTKYTTAIGMRP